MSERSLSSLFLGVGPSHPCLARVDIGQDNSDAHAVPPWGSCLASALAFRDGVTEHLHGVHAEAQRGYNICLTHPAGEKQSQDPNPGMSGARARVLNTVPGSAHLPATGVCRGQVCSVPGFGSPRCRDWKERPVIHLPLQGTSSLFLAPPSFSFKGLWSLCVKN